MNRDDLTTGVSDRVERAGERIGRGQVDILAGGQVGICIPLGGGEVRPFGFERGCTVFYHGHGRRGCLLLRGTEAGPLP